MNLTSKSPRKLTIFDSSLDVELIKLTELLELLELIEFIELIALINFGRPPKAYLTNSISSINSTTSNSGFLGQVILLDLVLEVEVIESIEC